MSGFAKFLGAAATVTELPSDLPPREGMPEQVATIANYFVHAPAAHPLWPNYLLFIVHLRDVEGQSRPPHRRFPDASHEIMLLALNPEAGPWRAETFVERMYAPRDVSAFLTPLNVCEQIRAATDAQAKQLCHAIARGIADGFFPIESQDVRGGKEMQRAAIAKTYEHIRLGGHPEDN